MQQLETITKQEADKLVNEDFKKRMEEMRNYVKRDTKLGLMGVAASIILPVMFPNEEGKIIINIVNPLCGIPLVSSVFFGFYSRYKCEKLISKLESDDKSYKSNPWLYMKEKYKKTLFT